MVFNDEGIDLENWKELLAKVKPMNMQEFIDIIRSKNLRNSVFADVTANDNGCNVMTSFCKKYFSVACNKVACSSSYDYYKKLKDLAREFNAPFLFETNVGAGLPVLAH